MTKNIHNGLGRIQRIVLAELAADKNGLDAIQLQNLIRLHDAFARGLKFDAADYDPAIYSSVCRALKRLQQAGKVGTLGYERSGRKKWVTAEHLARLIENDEITCALCQRHFQDGHYYYRLDNGDKVHSQCWRQQRDANGRSVNDPENPPPQYRYVNWYRRVNMTREACEELDARRR
jgi:hypothetical protein